VLRECWSEAKSVLRHWQQYAEVVAAVAAHCRLPQDVDKCFVPTEFCRQLGLGMGLAASQLVLYGLPIRPIFSKKLPGRNTLRKKLVRDWQHVGWCLICQMPSRAYV
jgi:hypothetical protein